MTWIYVAFGGGLGAMLRHFATVAATKLALGGATGATLFVNVAGGALMGILLGWLLERDIPNDNNWWIFLGTGVLGGFTTFSAFSRETVYMIQQEEYAKAGVYTGVSVIGSIAALMVALYITRRIFA